MLPIPDPQNHTRKSTQCQFLKNDSQTEVSSMDFCTASGTFLFFFFSDQLLTLILKSTLSVSVFWGKDRQQHIMILENWNRDKHLLPSDRVPKNSSLEQLKEKHLPWLSWVRVPEGLCKLPCELKSSECSIPYPNAFMCSTKLQGEMLRYIICSRPWIIKANQGLENTARSFSEV